MEYRPNHLPLSGHAGFAAVEYRNSAIYPSTAALVHVAYANALLVLVLACSGGIFSIYSASANISRNGAEAGIFLVIVDGVAATINLSLLLRERQWISGRDCLVDSSLTPVKMITCFSQNISERHI